MKNIIWLIITLFFVSFIQNKVSAQNFSGGDGDGYTGSNIVNFNLDDLSKALYVENVSASNVNGIYGISAVITIRIEFTQNIFVTGAPRLLLETGSTDRYANYSPISIGGATITFRYVIQAGDENADLDYTSVNALELNGGTIRNGAGEDASILLPDPGAQHSLGYNKDIEIDGIVPIVEITQAIGQADPTNSSPINFTASFSEDVTGFTATDVKLTGTAGATTLVVSGGPQVYNLSASGMTGNGTVIVDIGSGICTDLAGNPNTASSNIDNQIIYDAERPTVEITEAIGQIDPTNSSPVNFTAKFSEDVTGFISTDVSLSGTAGATTVVVSDGPIVYNLSISGMIGDGTVIVEIASDVCTDLAGNPNTASSNIDNQVIYDAESPTVEITQAIGQIDPTNSSPVNFTATFSENVTDFISLDVSLSGTADATTVVVSGGPQIFNLAVSGMTNDGSVIVDIASGVCIDLVGNDNAASINTDNQVTYDIENPTVEITQAIGQTDPTNSSPINFTASFSEDVTNFDNTDVNLSGTAGATTVVVTGGPQVFNLAVSGTTGDGSVIVDIASGVCTDLAGNDNAASTNTNHQAIYDITRPTIVISSSESVTTTMTNIPFTVIFSESVQGFTQDDINITNGSISGFTEDVQDQQWSGFINPSLPGVINVSIDADISTDFANNSNLSSNTFNIEFVLINHPPVAQNQVFSISEDSEEGTIIGTVVATDQDNDNMSFEIVSGNVDDLFSIDRVNGEISLGASNILNYDNITLYQLTVQIEDDGIEAQSTNCIVTINVIDVENPFEANNIFTPNDERNKYWLIKDVHNYKNYELIIRTATGQIVYETMDYNNDWDGRFNNKVLPTGTYYFSLVNKVNGKSYSGFINLIRN